jgi:CHAD domain-containing protein
MKEQEQDEVQISTAARALKRSLERALRNHRRAGKKLKATPVHDLRVSLRRCRSLAEGLSAIDPDPIWRRLRKASKKQQSALSDLRDLQVLESWLKPLRLTAGLVGEALAARLKKERRRAKKKASRSLDSFPRGHWKRWLRRLPARAELIPANQGRLAQLVLEQLTRVIELHNRWVSEREKAEPDPEVWHELRVTVKRFRYMVESFLPEKSEAWGEELSHAQDLLGEGHDLDVLRALIVKLFQKKKSLRKAETAVAKALRRVDAAAQKRREEYAELVCATAEEREPQAAAIDTEAEAAVGSAAGAGLAPERQSLWDRWRAELLSMAKVSGRGGAEPSRSAARRGSRAKASANRYPGRRRRISSAT